MRRRVRNGPIRLKHLSATGRWRSGNPRYYLRLAGQKAVPIPDLDPQSTAFKEAYMAALRGDLPATRSKAVSGTIRAGVEAYLVSDIHAGKAESTRALERRFGQEIADSYGSGTLSTLKPKHVRLALADLNPHPANNRLRLWRNLGRFWLDRGFVEVDPVRDVRWRKAPDPKGAKPWTRDDFTTFRNYWPIGTNERLAFEIFYQTCAAVVDASKLGPANIRDGWIIYKRQKSHTEAVSPLLDAPDWFEASHHLNEAIEAAPRHLTFLTTKAGASRSHKAVAAWFSKACTKSGLPDHSSHGIRKGRAAIFKENGAGVEKRMAILGHETENEARDYSKSADLIKTISGTETSNSPYPVGKRG